MIIKNAKICKTYWSKVRGLMFSPKKILIFEFKKPKKISLHMLFVFFPIYVYALNKNKKIIETKKLLPFISFFKSKQKIKYIIESPYKLETNINNQIKFKT